MPSWRACRRSRARTAPRGFDRTRNPPPCPPSAAPAVGRAARRPRDLAPAVLRLRFDLFAVDPVPSRFDVDHAGREVDVLPLQRLKLPEPEPGVQGGPVERSVPELRAWSEAHGGRPPRWSDWCRAYAQRHAMPFEDGWPSSGMVVAAFGSWDAGLAAAGFEPSRAQRARKARKAQLRKRNRRRERLLALRRQGKTNAEIAEILGLKPGHVASLFSRMRAERIEVPPGQRRWPESRA